MARLLDQIPQEEFLRDRDLNINLLEQKIWVPNSSYDLTKKFGAIIYALAYKVFNRLKLQMVV